MTTRKFSTLSPLVLAALLGLTLILAGCGGGSGGSSAALGGGGGGKAALNGTNIITITNNTGTVLGTGSITNGSVSFSYTTTPTSSDYPLLFTASGGVLRRAAGDQAFSGTLRAYVQESSTNINLTAFTTLHSYLFDRTSASLTTSERFTLATTWMNDFFDKMGVDVGASVNFLTDNPYSGANSLAYETAQQFLAYICNENDAAGLANIAAKLKTFADEYVTEIEAGRNPATAIANRAGTNIGTALANGNALANLLNTAVVKAAIAGDTVDAFTASGITGTGTPPKIASVESSISKPSDYTTKVAAITGVTSGEIQAGAAGDTTDITPGLKLGDDTPGTGDITVSWSSSYSVPANFIRNKTDDVNISNGGTFTAGDTITITLPSTAGRYKITLTSATNTLVTNTIIVETLADGTLTVTKVELRNSGLENNTTGVAFAGGTDGEPTILGDAGTASIASDRLQAALTVDSVGTPDPVNYIVNFLAPDGVRFIRGSGNYPNYAVTTTLSGTDTVVDAGITSMVISGNPNVGLKDFGVRVETTDGEAVVSDNLNMYVINADYQDYIAQITSLAYTGTKTGQADTPYDLSSGDWTGTIETWKSLAGLGASTVSATATYYDAPILKLIPGTSVANYGLTSDGTTWGNTATTAWNMTVGGSGARTFGVAGPSRAVKVPSATGSTNQAKVWIVLPATSTNNGGDITSTTAVTFTR